MWSLKLAASSTNSTGFLKGLHALPTAGECAPNLSLTIIRTSGKPFPAELSKPFVCLVVVVALVPLVVSRIFLMSLDQLSSHKVRKAS